MDLLALNRLSIRGVQIPPTFIAQILLAPVTVALITILVNGDRSIALIASLTSLFIAHVCLKPLKNLRDLIFFFWLGFRFIIRTIPSPYADEFFAYSWHSFGSRDVIALYASKNKLTANATKDLFLHQNKTQIATLGTDLDLKWLLNFARLLALQPITADDYLAATKIYTWVVQNHGIKILKRRLSRNPHQHFQVFLDLLAKQDLKPEWQNLKNELELIGIDSKYSALDALNPALSTDNKISNEWIKDFNKLFDATNTTPISFSCNANTMFDSILCQPKLKIEGPLVTVIVSAFNPSYEIITAIQSLLNQTYSNIEILIVDDCSTETSYITSAVNLDKKIRLIKQNTNQGTYAARNLGIRKAAGQFITVLDSDDWSHPDRIAQQVAPLLHNNGLVATMSMALRVEPNLLLGNLGNEPLRVNVSSLLFRKTVVDEIGEFDNARKGADSEFRDRLLTKYPSGLEILSNKPLALVRMGHASLSRSEFGTLWNHPVRQAYTSAYRYWHKRSEGNPFLSNILSGTRSFPAPSRYLAQREPLKTQEFDVLYVGDFSNSTTIPLNELHNELNALDSLGLRVGILQSRPLRMGEPLVPHVQDLLNSFRITQVFSDDSLGTKFLIVRNLRQFQFPLYLGWNVVAKSIVIAPTETSTTLKESSKRSSTRQQHPASILNPKGNEFEWERVVNNCPFPLSEAKIFVDGLSASHLYDTGFQSTTEDLSDWDILNTLNF